jgi:hypothetical protein
MQVSVELVSHRDTNPQLALTATDTSFWLEPSFAVVCLNVVE